MEIYTCFRIKTIIFLELIITFILTSCRNDEEINKLNKYYVEGAMNNGSTLNFRVYKMWSLENKPDYKFPTGLYMHQSDEIDAPIQLTLKNRSSQKTYDTTIHSPFPSYPFPYLKGITGNKYSLHIRIGHDSITSFFKIPDSFLVDTYALSTEFDNEYLHFNIKLPPAYLRDSIVFHDPEYRYTGDIFWDFCKTEYPISAQTVSERQYLDWYSYTNCQYKNFFDNGDHRYKKWRLMRFFEPNSGQPISALTINDYRYIRQLNEHVYKGLNGITQPVPFPSKFNSKVFYGGVIGFTSQLVKFKEP